MSDLYNARGQIRETGASTAVVASFMNGVYAWMCAGLCLTGIVALLTANSEATLRTVMSRGPMIVLFLVEVGLVVLINSMITRLSVAAATGLFLLFAAINGLMLSVIFLAYANATIAGAFMVTAGTFGATSAYGFITKRDLSGMRGMLIMALIGLIIASIANWFFASTTLDWIISYAGVAIFVGLTAYDTQKLKAMAYQTAGDPDMAGRLTILGSLTLYLDFINLFLFILRIMGGKRRG